ncbi:MAG: HYR domain-containing protein [Bacteroidetes bacterium]|nr:HYR domain-containing protein [Bacteroidota bacterium]
MMPAVPLFNVGTSQVRYTITDASGGSAACNFNITITDNTAPTFSFCPADMTVNASPGLCSTIVTWPNPVAVDNCPGVVVTQASGLPSGSSFPVGIYSIKYVATDAAGNSTTCIFTITVLDIESPVISNCPNNITIPSDPGFCTAVATWTSPNASDNCGGVSISQVDGLASGSAFPVGTTSISYKAIDAAGLSTLCTFTVTVEDNTSPAFLNCPTNVSVNNDPGQCNAVVAWVAPTINDNCSGATMSQISGPPSGSVFPVGVTPISYFALDASGNSATCSFNVTVVDSEQPQITCLGNVNVPNDVGVCTATVFGIAPQGASDNCPGSTITFTISGATTSTGINDASGTTFNQGTSLLTYSIKDAVGNITTCSFNVTVTPPVPSVSDAGPNQTICATTTSMVANNPTSGSGLWTLVSGNGIIVSPTSPTTQITGLSIGTAVFRWTISTSPCTFSSSDVSITAINTPSISFAGSDQTNLCGVTSTALAANTPTVGTGTWSIVSGAGGSFSLNTNPAATFTGTPGTTYVLRWTIANTPCTSSTDDVTISFNNNPTTANAGADQTNLCGVTSTTLAANTPTVGTGTWTIISGVGGSFSLNTNPAATFTGTLGTTYVLRWTIANAPCTSSSDDVTITFNNNPTIANAGTDQLNLCGVTSTFLAANLPSAGSGGWSIVSGAGGVVATPAIPSSSFTGTLGTTYVLRWTITNAPCVSSTDDVTITFNNNPTTANAGADQTNLCGVTSTALAANTPSVGTGTWSIISGAGGSFSINTNPVATFTGILGTTYVLRWTIANAPCTSSSDDVTITFNNNPTTANAGSDQTNLCGVTSTVLAANTPSVGTGTWSIISGAGGSFSINTNPVATFTGTLGTTYLLRWTIANAPCTSSSDDVTITFNNNPTTANAGADQTNLCGVTSTALAANTPSVGTGTWSIISGAGGSFSINTNPVATFTGTLGTTYILRWTIANAPCTSSSDDVTITFNNNPTTANAGSDQTNLCGVTSTVLAANTPSVGTGTWSIISGAGGSFSINTNPVATFTGTLGTTYVLRWTFANAPCTSSTDDVTITFNNNPTTANAGSDQTNLCGVTSTALAANTPSVGTGTWSIISGAGGSFSINTNPAATFTGTLGTTYILRWTIANAPCTSSTDDVTITFNNNPTTANAGADQTSLCGVTSTTLAANTPTEGTGTWTIISGVGGSFSLNTNPAAAFTGTLGTTYVLRWTIANAPCTSSSDDVTITFNNNPTAADAGADQTNLCGVTSTALAANTPSAGTGTWSIISGAGGSFSINTNPAATFTGALGTTYLLRWTIANAPCTSSSDDVTITFNNNPTTANAGADQTNLCGVTSTGLVANIPSVGTGTWSIVSGAGGSFSLNTNPAATFTGTPGTTYVLRWTIANAPCTSSTDDVTISFNNNPTTANAGADQTNLCGVTSTTLAANTPTVGTGTWTIISGVGGSFSLNTNPAATFTGTLGTTYVLRWTIANAPCTSSADDVTITFNNNPTTANAGPDQTGVSTCGLTGVTLAGNIPTSGTGTWSIVSGGSGSFTNVNQNNSFFSGSPGLTYILRWTISTACGTSTDDVSIKVNLNPSTAFAGNDATLTCNEISTILTANNPISGVGSWSILAGAGGSFSNNTDPLAVFTGTPTNTAAITYTLQWTISNAPCNSNNDQVEITFPRLAANANAGLDQTTNCSSSSTSLSAILPANHSGLWTIVSGTGGSFSNASSPTSLFSGVSGNSYQLRWTLTRIANGCTSSDDVTITFPPGTSIADAGPDQNSVSTCNLTSTTLSASIPTIGIGSWSIVSGLGGSFSDPQNPSTTFNGNNGTSYSLRWTIANPPCIPSTDDVDIVFNSVPTNANAGPDQVSLCGVSSIVLAANTPLIGLGNWTILSGSGGGFSAINDPNAIFNGVLGTAYQLRWTISNSPCIDSFDDVSITFNENPSISFAGINQTVCGTSAQLAANPPTSGSGNWSVISGSANVSNTSDPISSVNGLAIGATVLRWTISTANCGSSFSEVSIQAVSNPTIASAGLDQILCNVTNTALAANSPSVGTGIWTINSGVGGSFNDATDPNATFSGLAGETYQLVWTITNAPCLDSFDETQISFNTNPTLANAGIDQTICSSTAALAANVPLSGQGIWTLVSGAAQIANSLSPTTAVSGLAVGLNVFRWTISTTNCSFSNDDISIVVTENPSTAIAGSNQTICAGTTNLNADIPIVGSGVWSKISGSGTLVFPLSTNSPVTGLTAGSSVFQWTVSNGVCPPSLSSVTILVSDDPSNSSAGIDQTICGNSTTLAANSPTVGNGNWSVISGSGSFANPTNENTLVSGLSIGQNVFRWTISNPPCADKTDDVTITVNTIPAIADAGPDQLSLCGTSATNLAAIPAAIGTNGLWTIVSGTGGSIQTPTSSNSLFTGLPDSSYVLRWTISSVGCSDSFDEVTIQFKSLPVTANAGLNQTICENAIGITLNANPPLNGTGLWSVLSGNGSFSNSTSFNTPVTGFTTGNNSYLWTISNACGSTSDTVFLIVDAVPSTANAGTDQTLCESSNFLNLSGTNPLSGLGQWTLISGNATIATSSQANTLVTGLSLGQNVFEWSISNGVCPSSFDTVIVSIDGLPTPALAGSDSIICSGVFQLSANTPLVGSGSWSRLSGGASIANNLSPLTSVSGLTSGINSFVWAINNGTCAVSSDTINITVTDHPTIADAGPNQLICANTSQLAANVPLIGTGLWTLVSGNGIIANPSSEISQINGLAVGTSIFRWTISNGNCAASSADVNITVTPSTSLANAGPDSTICGNSIQLSAVASNNGIGTWSLVSGSGTILNLQSESTLVTGLGLGVNAFEWRIQNPPCADSFDTVFITVTSIPVTANAGADQLNLCGTNTTSLAADTNNQALGSWSIVSGNGGSFSDVFSPSSSFSGMIDSTYELRWTITALGCTGSADDVLIRFNSAPSTANAGVDRNDASTCGISSLILNANAPGSGLGAWNIVSGSGGSVSSNSPTATFSGISGNTYTLEWSISTVCGISRDTMSITFNQLANLANAGVNQQICESAVSVQLAANSPFNGIGNWSVLSGSGSFSNNSTENALLTGLSLGLNTYAWTISSVNCGSSVDTMSVQVDALPSAASAGTDQQICESTASVNLTANAPVSGAGYWSSLNAAVQISDTLASSTSATALLIGSNLFVWTISNGTCPNTMDTTAVLVAALASPSNAGADQAICENVPSLILAANSPVSGTGNWSVISGTAIFFDITSENSSVGGLSPGQNQLVWTISNGNCPASSDTISVIVHSMPDAANAGLDQQVCENSGVVNLLANTPLIGTGNWKLLSGTGTIADTTSNSTSLNGISAGVEILIWTISNGACFTKDTLVVTVDAPPTTANAGSDKAICTPFTRLKADTALIGVGVWTLAAGATGNILNPNSDTTAVLAMSIGVNSFIWTVSNGICPSSVDTVNVTVSQNATIADAGPDQTVCVSVDSVNLAANIALNGTGSWRLVSGSGTISDTTNANTSVKALGAGVNLLAWVIKNGICTSSDIVKITVDELPTTANAGINQNICESTTQVNLSANAPTVGVGLWSGPGTFSNSSSESSNVTGFTSGINSYIWSISNGACAATSDTVEIAVDALPSPANAGSDQTFCNNNLTTVNLNASSPLTGNGVWSTTSSAVIDIITATNSSVSNLAAGLSSFVWTVNNGVCPSSSDTTKIEVDQLPTQALAGNDQSSCDTFYVLNANNALIGFGQWSKLSGGGVIANPNAPVSNVSGLSMGANTFVWTIANGVCVASADTVSINVSAPPSASNAGINQQICISNPSANLSANIPVNGSGQWSVVAGTGIIVSGGQPSTLVNNLSTGINSFIWTISNGLCGDTKDTVEIQVDELPDIAATGSDQTYCESAAGISISANTPTIGTGQWFVGQGNGSVLNPNSPLSTVTFSLGTNAYIWKISNGACPVSQDTCFVLIDSLSPIAFAGNNQTLCESNSISLNASAVSFGTGSWSSPTPGVGIANPSQPNSNATGLTIGQNSFIWTTINGVCPTSTDTVIISIDQAPSVAHAGPDLTFCDTTNQIRLQGNAIITGSATWLPILGTGTILQPNDSNSLVSGLVAGLSSFEWVVTNGICPASRDTVLIVLNESPSNSSAGSNQNICENTTTITLNANTPIIGNGVWSLLSGTGSISDTNSVSPIIGGLSVGSSVFKWTIKNGLCVSASTVVIKVDELPSPAYAGEDKNVPGPSSFLEASSPSIGLGAWSVVQGTASFADLIAPNTSVSNLSPGASVLQWTVTNGVCPSSSDDVTINYEDLQIPNAISPNNDGFNDAFVIPGLEFYSGVKFTLYNSWGIIEYQSDNYQNEFKGENKSGQALLDDTYYYILQITSNIEYKGYLIIKK